MNVQQLKLTAWALSVLAVVLAVVAWGQGFAWQFGGLSLYQIFPLFGLVGFSLMWSHYIAGALRVYFKLPSGVLGSYFPVTSGIVLFAIIFHPSLLAYQLWRDGLGLPPSSELHYLSSDVTLYIVIAMFALAIFLAYELHRFYGKRSWWKYVQYASDVAMWLIFVHALKVGQQLQTGWFRFVWFIYGISLLAALIYTYKDKFTKPIADKD